MTRQNIVLFLTDQWRWDTLNTPGNPAKLPNLQDFAKSATNYVNAFTSVPLCTPARGSLFTGKWPHQNGTMDNVQGNSFYPFGKLHPDQPTYLEALAKDGYNVVFVGKWHLGDGSLADRGIKCVMSDGGAEHLGSNPSRHDYAPAKKPPFYATITDGSTPVDGLRVAAGLEQLRELAAEDKPFCLVIAPHGPHFPHFVPQEYVALYDDLPMDFMPDNFCPQFSETGKPLAQAASYWPCQDTSVLDQQDWRRTAQHYWAYCSYLDNEFGKVRRAISELGVADTTTVMFTADHGEMLGAHGWFDKGPFFYEEVMRIPMLVHQGSQTAPSTAENFVGFRDIFPTLMDLAGAEDILSDSEIERSFVRSKSDFATYCYDAYQGRQFKFRGIRTSRYKYAWSPHDIAELYDVEADPGERINLAQNDQFKAIRYELHERLFAWMRSEQDSLAYPGHQLPVGSYIDGRPVSEQHIHSPAG